MLWSKRLRIGCLPRRRHRLVCFSNQVSTLRMCCSRHSGLRRTRSERTRCRRWAAAQEQNNPVPDVPKLDAAQYMSPIILEEICLYFVPVRHGRKSSELERIGELIGPAPHSPINMFERVLVFDGFVARPDCVHEGTQILHRTLLADAVDEDVRLALATRSLPARAVLNVVVFAHSSYSVPTLQSLNGRLGTPVMTLRQVHQPRFRPVPLSVLGRAAARSPLAAPVNPHLWPTLLCRHISVAGRVTQCSRHVRQKNWPAPKGTA